MKLLFLLQGIPGSGKSTFIQQNGLEPYTISTDQLRLLYGSPVMTEHGNMTIDQKLSGKAWGLLFELLEARMKNGDLTIVDATHCNKDTIAKYKGLVDKYRYRVFIIRFEATVAEANQRDQMRPEYKQVGTLVISRMYQQMPDKNPGWTETITPDQFKDVMKWESIAFDQYEKIVHFGDLQGCYEPLRQYFENNPYSEKNLYVFVGDLVDRGIQNVEVVQWFIENYRKPNIILVEGNHEHHLKCWSNDEPIVSDEFANKTKAQLEAAGVDKKAVRQMYRKSRQMLSYTFKGTKVLVSHAGLPHFPSNEQMTTIPTRQFIKGVGAYEIDIDAIWEQSCKHYEYQVHGHRNAHMRPLKDSQKSFNLEGGVEFGGALRIAELSEAGWKTIEIPNEIFDDRQERAHHPNIDLNDGNFLTLLKGNRNIIEKNLGGNISSFNFDRDTFYDKLWNKQSVKARGLFVNTATKQIVARSYEKFFNLNEMEFTKTERLMADLKYPLTVWKKENGFLGILGYDKASDELIIASKSTTKSDFAGYFKSLLEKQVNLNEMRDWIKDKNFSLVFEVIDVKNDPHIIEYPESKLVLLDIIYNEIKFDKAPYEYLKVVGRMWNLEVKQAWESVPEIRTPEGLDTLVTSLVELETVKVEDLEGFVIEDSAGFMFKIKLPYYNFWKYMRGVKEQMYKNPGYILASNDELTNQFMLFLSALNHEQLKADIITLRKAFLQWKN